MPFPSLLGQFGPKSDLTALVTSLADASMVKLEETWPLTWNVNVLKLGWPVTAEETVMAKTFESEVKPDSFICPEK